ARRRATGRELAIPAAEELRRAARDALGGNVLEQAGARQVVELDEHAFHGRAVADLGGAGAPDVGDDPERRFRAARFGLEDGDGDRRRTGGPPDHDELGIGLNRRGETFGREQEARLESDFTEVVPARGGALAGRRRTRARTATRETEFARRVLE